MRPIKNIIIILLLFTSSFLDVTLSALSFDTPIEFSIEENKDKKTESQKLMKDDAFITLYRAVYCLFNEKINTKISLYYINQPQNRLFRPPIYT